MNERLIKPTAAHRAFRDDAIALLRKHAGELDAKDMLAMSVAANMLGKLVAMQDQRKMTPAMGMETIARNIEVGNAEAIAEVNSPAGKA